MQQREYWILFLEKLKKSKQLLLNKYVKTMIECPFYDIKQQIIEYFYSPEIIEYFKYVENVPMFNDINMYHYSVKYFNDIKIDWTKWIEIKMNKCIILYTFPFNHEIYQSYDFSNIISSEFRSPVFRNNIFSAIVFQDELDILLKCLDNNPDIKLIDCKYINIYNKKLKINNTVLYIKHTCGSNIAKQIFPDLRNL